MFRLFFPLTRAALAITGLFLLCQVMGVMCALPDLSMAEQDTITSQEGMTCPMDGTIMCPPSAISTPERQAKHGLTLDLDHAQTLFVAAKVVTVPLTLTLWSWSNDSSIVPISIRSSSVLRI